MFNVPASIRLGARLDEIATAVAAASGKVRLIYVERRGADKYRWSPAHRGGPYPLLRETARLLGVSHHGFVLPFGGVPTTPPAHYDADGFWVGTCFIPADESVRDTPADMWTVLEFDAPQSFEEVRARIRDALASVRDLTA